MARQGIDSSKLRTLYDEYGSLEKAVDMKREELKKIDHEKAEATSELTKLDVEVKKEKHLLENLEQKYNQCRSQIEAAEKLNEEGFTLPVLKKINALVVKLNLTGPEELLDALQKYDSVSQLGLTAQNLASEKRALTSNCNRLKKEQDELQKSVDNLKPRADSLSKDVEAKNLSCKHLTAQIQSLLFKKGVLYKEVTAKEAAKEILEASIGNMQNQLTDLETLRQQKETLQADIRTMESSYEEYVSRFNKLSSLGTELNKELVFAKHMALVEKYPVYAKDLPAEYIHTTIWFLDLLSTAKGFNPTIRIKTGDLTYSEDFLTILNQVEKALIERKDEN